MICAVSRDTSPQRAFPPFDLRGFVLSAAIFSSGVALRAPAQTLGRRVTHPPGRLIRPSWVKGMGVPPSLLRLSWCHRGQGLTPGGQGVRLSRKIRCRLAMVAHVAFAHTGQIGSPLE